MLERTLIIPDQHFPYNDKRYWKLLLKVGRAWKPHRIITLGDFGDFYASNRHPKDPNRSRDLATEIQACNVARGQLDRLGAKEKVFVAGNHEDNLARFLAEKAPELFNMVKVERLLELKENGWKYVPYKNYTRVGKIYFTHDAGAAGAIAHTRAAARFGGSVVIGHTHRCAVSYSTTVDGRGHVAAMFGWGGDRDAATYMYKVNTTDWALGFGTGRLEPDGTLHLAAHPVIKYKVVVDGVLYEG